MGQLTWLADDNTPQTVTVDTIDDGQPENPEDLRVEFNLLGDLIINFNYEVSITDNEGTASAGVEIIADGPLRTSEDGSSASFRVALTRAPTDPVTLNLSTDQPAEVSFVPNSLGFTVDNWNQPQAVTVTGLDDPDRDFNRTAQVIFTAASNDQAYQDLFPVIAYVVNVDDEKDELLFANGFE